MNALLGAKVAIVTPKPQTTRDRILGILTGTGFQLLFHDTPGIHEPRKALNRVMVAEAEAALADADVVLVVTDARKPAQGLRDDALVLERVAAAGKPAVLALNKIDLIEKPALLPLIDAYGHARPFAAIVPVCALAGDGLDRVRDELAARVPEGPALYPDDELSDRPMRFVVAEVVREKVMLATHQEIPYSAAVTIDEYVEGEAPAAVRISATIHVERDSQKAIVIGRAGSMLKRIGTEARHEIEGMVERKVFLKLFVKVDPAWAETEEGIRRLRE
jgi:GTP-binding protein Era